MEQSKKAWEMARQEDESMRPDAWTDTTGGMTVKASATETAPDAKRMESQKSISNQLTISLVMTIGVISITMIVAMYVYRVRNAEIELNQQADELLTYLVGIVERPLWDMNEEDVTTIGEVISRNDLVNNVVIKDSYGQSVYRFERESHPNLIERTGKVYHNRQFAGDVFLAFNQKAYDESSGDMLLSSLLVVSVTSIILIAATGFLVRRFLKGPLESLNAIVDAYVAGIYAMDAEKIPYQEFQPFGRVLEQMGTKITRHIEEVRLAEENYRNIFENAVEGIFQSSLSGRYLSVSPSFAQMAGYSSPEEMIAEVNDIRSLCYAHPKKRDHFVRRLLEQDTVKGLEVQQIRRDGSRFWVSLSGRLIRDNQGEPKYIEGFSMDITNRKNLESQLRQAHKLEAIGTLAGGIAHDFKNILGVIIVCTELEMTIAPDTSEAQIYLKKVRDAGSRATKLVNKVLTFSRQTESEIKPIHLGRIAKETIKFIRATLPATIDIREEILPNSGPALADPTQIHQVLMNLCTNAAQAMQPRGGVLEIKLEEIMVDVNDAQENSNSGKQPFIQLSVSDTGPGMSAETAERIFDPFFTTKPVGEGTGLGLSVAHGIIEKHYGSITVDSEPGHGALFKILIPAVDPSHIRMEKTCPANPAKGTGNLLLVDDERELVETLADMLKDLGYTVTATHRSLDALKMFRADPEAFDAVITDLTMPDMTGIHLAREIVRIAPDKPVALCTGFSEEVLPDRARAAGIGEILQKPVVLADLSVAVGKLLTQE